jgi:hypothetical protein
VEPISALLILAGSHGAVALVKSLTGVDELADLSGELVRALTATESRIDERLVAIESRLDELLDQAYGVALRRGVRYLLDAGSGNAATRSADLDRAREAFVEATAAARSPLQQAVAERYLLLVLLGLRRTDAVPASLYRVEEYATAAVFDAVRTSEVNREAATALLRREGEAPGRFGGGTERLRAAQLEVKRAAVESVGMGGRLLAEMAMLRPTLGLPPVAAPPTDPIVDETLMTLEVKQTRTGVTVESSGTSTTRPYWRFEAGPDAPLRVGALTVTVSPEPVPTAGLPPIVRAALGVRRAGLPALRGHVQVEVRAPLSVPVTLVSPTASWSDWDRYRGQLPPGAAVGHAPLVWGTGAPTSTVVITPQYVATRLIEVTCRL